MQLSSMAATALGIGQARFWTQPTTQNKEYAGTGNWLRRKRGGKALAFSFDEGKALAYAFDEGEALAYAFDGGEALEIAWMEARLKPLPSIEARI